MSNSQPDILDVSLQQLPASLQTAVGHAGWKTLMPVQARAIPHLLARRDVIIQARTGSGKTGAFLLPMLERLDGNRRDVQALVLVPTRELASQVWRETEMLFNGSGLRTVAMYGGVGYGPQMEALRQGAHVVVGTPGRVLDHLLKGTLSLGQLEMLIFDEADRMLSIGFYPDMKQIQRYLPGHAIHSCMFSATFPPNVLRTAHEFIAHPEFLSLSKDQVHATDTDHVCYIVPAMEKERCLVRFIEIENPTSAIIFCNTKSNVHFVSVVLQRFGYDSDELSADLSQHDRERVLERVRRGALRFLVATDVAARGLDIPDLSHVIQYEPPEDPEIYVHRSGRTGRAGASGIAVSLVSEMEKLELDRIARRFNITLIEKPVPTNADVEAVVAERLTALLEARLRERDKLQAERSRRFIPLARSLAENEDESAVIAMLLDDYYQQSLHARPPTSDAQSPPPVRQAPPRDRQGGGESSRHRRPFRRRR